MQKEKVLLCIKEINKILTKWSENATNIELEYENVKQIINHNIKKYLISDYTSFKRISKFIIFKRENNNITYLGIDLSCVEFIKGDALYTINLINNLTKEDYSSVFIQTNKRKQESELLDLSELHLIKF